MFEINGIWWKLYFVSSNDPMLFRSDGSLTLGACDNEINTIFINKELDDELFKKVLCHEIVHAAMFSYGVKLSLYREELLADLIATYGQEIIQITNEIFSMIV